MLKDLRCCHNTINYRLVERNTLQRLLRLLGDIGIFTARHRNGRNAPGGMEDASGKTVSARLIPMKEAANMPFHLTRL
ncbi:hypothetical protein OK016_27485 [Vibrio chagasii]|nr:hypothetical protein [Vibrio chagasii]